MCCSFGELGKRKAKSCHEYEKVVDKTYYRAIKIDGHDEICNGEDYEYGR